MLQGFSFEQMARMQGLLSPRCIWEVPLLSHILLNQVRSCRCATVHDPAGTMPDTTLPCTHR